MKGFAFVFALVLLLAPTLAAAVNLPTLSLGDRKSVV